MACRSLAIALALTLSACGQTAWRDSANDTDRVYRPPVDAKARFTRALQAMEAGDADAALVAMEKLAEDYPWLSGPALNTAIIHRRQGRKAQAQEWYQRALQINGANLEARNAYGIFLRNEGRYREAEQQYLDALEIDAAHALTHYNLAILCDLYLGEKDRALAHFSRYQDLVAEEDKQVTGWVVDLKRQIANGGGV